MKTETVKPNDITAGETILLNGVAYTVGRNTVKTDFYGTTVCGLRMKSVERVLFPKFYKGILIGFVSNP